jgi:D-alanyl-D-alanine dipeptidase
MRAAGALLILVLSAAAAYGQSCPEPLASARRLVLVTSQGVSTSNATIQRFERGSTGDAWRPVSGPQSALIGRNGMAWAYAFRSLARTGEPIKVDGDKRVPAGVFKIGSSFGFAPSNRPGYLQSREGTVCVDDVSSAAYNTITSRAKVGTLVHGENMWRASAYKHGLLVDYPTDRRNRAGSCIFIHIRLPSSAGTGGCVAVPEPQVLELQAFAEPGAVLAAVPEHALARFAGCLPQR